METKVHFDEGMIDNRDFDTTELHVTKDVVLVVTREDLLLLLRNMDENSLDDEG
jgi:hypothetical protein